MAAIPNELFTQESFLTLAGAVAITTVITNTCQYVFNWNPKWFGLFFGILISIIGVCLTKDPKFINYLLGFFNGFLIYASAAGIMQMAGTPRIQNLVKPEKRQFFNKWY